MGFRSGAYATVWEVKDGNGNYSDVRLSIPRKNRDGDGYVTEFSAWVRFIGDAHRDASMLSERSRIKLGDCDVTNKYDKEKNTTYTNYAVFGFEDANGGSGTAEPARTSTDSDGFMQIPDNIDEELPFV